MVSLSLPFIQPTTTFIFIIVHSTYVTCYASNLYIHSRESGIILQRAQNHSTKWCVRRQINAYILLRKLCLLIAENYRQLYCCIIYKIVYKTRKEPTTTSMQKNKTMKSAIHTWAVDDWDMKTRADGNNNNNIEDISCFLVISQQQQQRRVILFGCSLCKNLVVDAGNLSYECYNNRSSSKRVKKYKKGSSAADWYVIYKQRHDY